jgi:prepilin-type N-terminal cleavage/methylation domain-containing protein
VSRLGAQDGFTLTEVLIAMTLFVVILIPTLGTLDGFSKTNATALRQNDAQDQARTAIDRLAREMRNLASPTNVDAKSIDLANATEIVFKTVDPVKRRIRYCLDTSTSTLWQQTQAFPLTAVDPGLPPPSSCPGPINSSQWGTQTVVASHVVNGGARAVFTYSGLGDGTDTAKVTAVGMQIYLDVNPGVAPAESSIATVAYLRNQNQKPVLTDFSLNQNPPGSRTFDMNGSQATDPEGRTLDYFWYEGTGATTALPDCLTPATQTGGGFTCLGRGLTLSHTFGAGAGTRSVTLKVIDPGGLSVVLTKQTPTLS